MLCLHRGAVGSGYAPTRPRGSQPERVLPTAPRMYGALRRLKLVLWGQSNAPRRACISL